MKQDPAQSVQLLLTVPVITLEEISRETERQLISALADLLLDAAMHSESATEGGNHEREDSR